MDSRRTPPSPARLERLAAELHDEGLGFLLQDDRDALLEELDYALRPPVHERRVPSYGVIVNPRTSPEEWTRTTHLVAERRRTAQYGDAVIRRFADGISSFAVRTEDGVDDLIVFDRSAGSERDLVLLAEAAQGIIVQRHPAGPVRVVSKAGVSRHDIGGWRLEPPLRRLLERVPGCRDSGAMTTLGRLLDFAVHDLGSRGIGSLLIVHPTGELSGRHENRLPDPPTLRLDRPHDLAPLRHALAQTDGATVFDTAGALHHMGIRLIPSAEAETAVRPMGGTRHTSARRFSFDQSEAVVVVVSDDGPVTVFQNGEIIGRSVVSLTDVTDPGRD